jgi:hypothetical protein
MNSLYQILIKSLDGVDAPWLSWDQDRLLHTHRPTFYDDNWTVGIYANGYVCIRSYNGWTTIHSLDDYRTEGLWEQLLHGLRNDLWTKGPLAVRFQEIIARARSVSCMICRKTTGENMACILEYLDRADSKQKPKSKVLIGCSACLSSEVQRVDRESRLLAPAVFPWRQKAYRSIMLAKALDDTIQKVSTIGRVLQRSPFEIMDAINDPSRLRDTPS